MNTEIRKRIQNCEDKDDLKGMAKLYMEYPTIRQVIEAYERLLIRSNIPSNLELAKKIKNETISSEEKFKTLEEARSLIALGEVEKAKELIKNANQKKNNSPITEVPQKMSKELIEGTLDCKKVRVKIKENSIKWTMRPGITIKMNSNPFGQASKTLGSIRI